MADMTPPAGAPAFLAIHGWSGTISPVAGDASFRRYFRVTQANRTAILMDAPPPHEDPRPFIAIAQWLRERGFETVSLYDMQNALAFGQPLPAKPIVISFDDGYRGVYDFAFPVMRAHGYTGTLFLPTELIDKQEPDYINWQMAEELARAGWKIEPHTKSHVELPGQPHNYILYQALGSMETIRAHVGYQPRYFCYPEASTMLR